MRIYFLIQNDSFPFLFFFPSEFQVFSYAYGGLHRWSPHGEKAAKIGFGIKKKKKKKQKKKVKEKKKVKHNLTNYSKKILNTYLLSC